MSTLLLPNSDNDADNDDDDADVGKAMTTTAMTTTMNLEAVVNYDPVHPSTI